MRAGEFEVPAWMAITVYFATDLFGAVIGMFAKHGGGGWHLARTAADF